MSTAPKFTTLGRGNGFPVCFEKVDVTDQGDGNPYSYWTTFSGYNETAVIPPTAQEISESHVLACKVFWNLEIVNVDAQVIADPSINPLPNMNVNGQEWNDGDGTPDDSVKPSERVCDGPYSTYNKDAWQSLDACAYGQIKLNSPNSIVRMYSGATTNEGNFIGYGSGLIDWDSGAASGDWAPILASATDGNIVDDYAGIGGYIIEPESSGRLEGTDYVTVDDISFVFHGLAADSGVDGVVTPTSLLAETNSGGNLIARAQIEGFEFFTY